MNKIFLTILLIIQCALLFAQDLSEIERKYDFVEIWGLEDLSKEDFLTEITSYPEGICQQSLVKMGFVDGNKIPIPFSNKILVTIRDIPKYAPKNKIRLTNGNKLKKWEEFKSDFKELGFYERQQVPFFEEFYVENNQRGLDSLFRELHAEFTTYGINLDKEKIIESLVLCSNSADQFSKEDVLSALYHLGNRDTIQEAAVFVALKHLNNKEDLLDFLPLLLKKGSGVQSLLTTFLNDHDGKIDWADHMDLLVKLANNPNPYQSVLVLRIVDKTGFSKNNMKSLLSFEMKTMKDMLGAKYVPEELADYLSIFLNKYSGLPIEQDKSSLLERLR